MLDDRDILAFRIECATEGDSRRGAESYPASLIRDFAAVNR